MTKVIHLTSLKKIKLSKRTNYIQSMIVPPVK